VSAGFRRFPLVSADFRRFRLPRLPISSRRTFLACLGNRRERTFGRSLTHAPRIPFAPRRTLTACLGSSPCPASNGSHPKVIAAPCTRFTGSLARRLGRQRRSPEGFRYGPTQFGAEALRRLSANSSIVPATPESVAILAPEMPCFFRSSPQPEGVGSGRFPLGAHMVFHISPKRCVSFHVQLPFSSRVAPKS
jgi:hypothetical protein